MTDARIATTHRRWTPWRGLALASLAVVWMTAGLAAEQSVGAGGIAVTGYNGTSTYQNTAPDLTVTGVNGTSPARALPDRSAPGTPEETGRAYDESMRKALNLPPEWFSCKRSDECALAHVSCSTSLAVGKPFKQQLQALTCKGGDCADVCLASTPDTSAATCRAGQCATITP